MNPEEEGKTKEKSPEPKPEKQAAAASRLGKEAKVGVAVILGLLGVLIVAVVFRVTGGGSTDQAVAVASPAAEKQKSTKRPAVDKLFEGDKLFKDVKAKSAPAEPTVVPARAAVGKPPRQDDSNFDPFRFANRHDAAPRPRNGLAPSAPSLQLPEPPVSLSARPSEQRKSAAPPQAVAKKREDDSRFIPPKHQPPAKAALAAAAPRHEDKRKDSPALAMPTPSLSLPDRAPAIANGTDRPSPPKTSPDRKNIDLRRDAPKERYATDEPRRAAPVRSFSDSLPPLHPPTPRDQVAGNSVYPAQPSEPRPAYRPGRTYTVADGDTLFDIARTELGKASRWVEIYELNRAILGEDFNDLKPGTRLTLPDDHRETMAEPPSASYRR